jgi:subtilisin family serine protease
LSSASSTSSSKTERLCRPALALLLLYGSALCAEVEPRLTTQATATGKPVDALIVFPRQATSALAPLRADADYLQRRAALVDALRARADADQASVRQWLGEHGIAYRTYWIADVIAAPLDAQQLRELGARDDIARIAADARLPSHLPQPAPSTLAVRTDATVAWGVAKIDAPLVWALGDTGQGVVLAGEDTGYQWDHPALKPHYRGWNGSSAQHAYSWHDAIHVANAHCPADSPAPCDDDGHGTHTMGTMLGDDGAGNEIGVAPGARWIGCRNMDAGKGTPARYIECMQWMLAPTDTNGQNPRPDLAPDIVSNSWACVPDEGCTVGDEIEDAVDNLVAGGIFYVAAAGNEGAGCTSIGDPPAIYASSFVVGATDSSDSLAYFSSRGPVTGAARTLPDIVAPGVAVLSSVPPWNVQPNDPPYKTMSGTSMATPHVAGVAALMMTMNPRLKGHPDRVADLLRASAVRAGIIDLYNSGCGGLTMADWPNDQAGSGRLDAYAAVILADTIFADGYDD